MFLGPVDDDPQTAEVKRLSIRPGDRLVVKLDHEASDDEADRIKASVKQAFASTGYVPPVLLLGPGAEIGVIGPEPGLSRNLAGFGPIARMFVPKDGA